jgi:hypothetical protein
VITTLPHVRTVTQSALVVVDRYVHGGGSTLGTISISLTGLSLLALLQVALQVRIVRQALTLQVTTVTATLTTLLTLRAILLLGSVTVR